MANASKAIFDRQNLQGLVEEQKTAHYCYRKGKWLSLLLIFFQILLPIATNVIIIFTKNDIVSTILIVLSFIEFIVGEIIKHCMSRAKFLGACLQQHFDEFVFELKNSSRKWLQPDKLTRDERLILIGKYKNKSNERFYNWYSDYSALPYEQAVYNCQKENLRWDLNIRKKYLILLIVMCSCLSLGLIINAICQRMNIITLIVALSSLAPVGSYFCGMFRKLGKDISIQKLLLDKITAIDEKQQNAESIWDEIEELQVEIFKYRKSLYLIPDWFYKIFRPKMQAAEDTFAKDISSNNIDP